MSSILDQPSIKTIYVNHLDQSRINAAGTKLDTMLETFREAIVKNDGNFICIESQAVIDFVGVHRDIAVIWTEDRELLAIDLFKKASEATVNHEYGHKVAPRLRQFRIDLGKARKLSRTQQQAIDAGTLISYTHDSSR
ncbi:MAG: hypothetical protein AAGH88_03255 [Planctomycetota bacterium]